MRNNVRAVRRRVGANIRQLRKLKRLTLEELGEQIGHAGKYIGDVELGKENVSLDILTRIATKLSVDVEVLCRAASADASGPRSYIVTERDLDQLGDHFAQAADVIERVKRSVR